MQLVVVRRFERSLQRLDGRERILQLDQFARRDALGRDPPRNPLQIAYQRHLFADGIGQHRIARKVFDDIQPAVDPFGILDRHGDPALQQTAAHRRQCTVDDVGKAALFARAVRREELQVADRELVDPHVVVLIDARDRGDVACLVMLGEVQIVEDGAGGRDAAREVVDAESLERLRTELLAQFLAVDLLREDPLVEAVGVEPRPEAPREAIVHTSLINNLFRLKIRDQLVNVGVRPLGNVEFARRDVEERHAGRLATEVDRRDEVVLLVGQDVVAENDARRHQFDHAALDQPLDEFRILELFADRHPLTRPDQLRQVGVHRMVGKSRQLDIRSGPVGPPCQRDAQDAARLDGVIAEGLVEVSHAEEQNGVGMHRLDGVVLLHQRGLDVFVFVGFLVGFLFRSHSQYLFFR